jgi:cytochrome b involved in lipid metabolism
MKKILSLIACTGLIVTTSISTIACTNVTKDQFSKIKGAVYDGENNIILLPSEMQKLADSFGKDLIDENDDSRSQY